MTGTLEWRGSVGDAWAEEWRRTDRSLEPVNRALVERASAFAPARILDVGCGAGATSLALAHALPGAAITGIDLSGALIGAARERAGPNSRIRFEAADAASWRPDSGAFDLLVSRHGIMFFDDPVAAFAHLRALTAPGGRLLFSCFRARADNDWAVAMRPVFARFAPEMLDAPEPPTGPFAFAAPARIEQVLEAAGFAPPRIEPLDCDFLIGEGEDPVADALRYFARIGPVARLLAELDDAARASAMDAVADIVESRRTEGRVAFRAAAWIVSSEKVGVPT